MEVALEKHNFSPGEIIKGTVSFKLKKPTQAEQLVVTFAGVRHATKRVRNRSMSSSRRRGGMSSGPSYSTQTRQDFIHKFELALDEGNEYSDGEYPFEIKIPENVIPQDPTEDMEGALGTVVKTAKFLGGGSSRIEWYVEAKLDIPKSIDVNKKIDINIG